MQNCFTGIIRLILFYVVKDAEYTTLLLWNIANGHIADSVSSLISSYTTPRLVQHVITSSESLVDLYWALDHLRLFPKLTSTLDPAILKIMKEGNYFLAHRIFGLLLEHNSSEKYIAKLLEKLFVKENNHAKVLELAVSQAVEYRMNINQAIFNVLYNVDNNSKIMIINYFEHAGTKPNKKQKNKLKRLMKKVDEKTYEAINKYFKKIDP